jgi:hypothetical protein
MLQALAKLHHWAKARLQTGYLLSALKGGANGGVCWLLMIATAAWAAAQTRNNGGGGFRIWKEYRRRQKNV